MRTIILALLTAVATSAAAAKTPERLDALEREMRILDDVMTAALRDAGGPARRVGNVDVSYLAEQGVLIAVSLKRSWFGSYRQVVEVDAEGDVSLAMPTIVRDILTDLQIPLEPGDAEERQGLREERRALRSEMRELRTKIREARRNRSDDAESEAEIEQLRSELQALREEREALHSELRDQYAQVHVLRKHGPDDGDEPSDDDAGGFDAALLQAVCDYGLTLKSLPKDERLSVQVRAHGENTFHVFKFEDVLECASDDMTPAELQEAAFVYSVEGDATHHMRGRHHRRGRHHPQPPGTPLTPPVPPPPGS